MKTNILCAGTAVSAAVLMMGAYSSSAAQTAANPDKTDIGTVSAVNGADRTLEVKGLLLNKKFNLGTGCTFTLLDHPSGAIGDLQPGQRVIVSYQDANGVLVADKIKEDPMAFEGMVTAIDTTRHTVTVRHDLRDRTFQFPEDCMIALHGGKSGTLGDIQPGDRVTVMYERLDDRPTAREIRQTDVTFTGAVTAIDTTDQTVKARALYGSKVFHLADGCAIMVDGKPTGHLNDLQLGERVQFTYDDVNGVNIVNRIGNAPVSQQTETTSVQPPVP